MDVFPSTALLAKAYTRDAGALDALKGNVPHLLTLSDRNPTGSWERLHNVVEGLALFGQTREAGALYPLVLKALEHGSMLTYGARLWQLTAGIAAAAQGEVTRSREHFETALRQADALPHRSCTGRDPEGGTHGCCSRRPLQRTTKGHAFCLPNRWRSTRRFGCPDTSRWSSRLATRRFGKDGFRRRTPTRFGRDEGISTRLALNLVKAVIRRKGRDSARSPSLVPTEFGLRMPGLSKRS